MTKNEQLAWELRKIMNRPTDPADDPDFDRDFPPWEEWDTEDQQATLADLEAVRKLLVTPPLTNRIEPEVDAAIRILREQKAEIAKLRADNEAYCQRDMSRDAELLDYKQRVERLTRELEEARKSDETLRRHIAAGRDAQEYWMREAHRLGWKAPELPDDATPAPQPAPVPAQSTVAPAPGEAAPVTTEIDPIVFDPDVSMDDKYAAMLRDQAAAVKAAREADGAAFARERAKLDGRLSHANQVSAALREALVHAGIEGVWRWQGDGSDHPDSLSCPVVMSAETARKMDQTARDLDEIRARWADRGGKRPFVVTYYGSLEDCARMRKLLNLDQPAAKPDHQPEGVQRRDAK